MTLGDVIGPPGHVIGLPGDAIWDVIGPPRDVIGPPGVAENFG